MSNEVNVKIKRLHPDAVIPQYATDLAAGFDLVAVEDVIIAPGETAKVPLGLAFEIPPGYVVLVCMRSGIALKTKLRQPNGIGVIDADYRGEVAMMFDNTRSAQPIDEYCEWPTFLNGEEAVGVNLLSGEYIVRKSDKVAQAFVLPYPRVNFVEVEELTETARGTGGFGSSGIQTEASA
ncbi:deoxyuridine 5'-triphosphate nucleotidohydrolase [Paenibacillus graminis]|uniref:dUTP diphosphatase n=1 Tax=Paenibacillus graminis TaxID=189425 RepID=UPI002DB62A61|nr:deoxyuridine 5'-triphosphate nucleotidohydrolase [Paenibacillus graminis]MEC0167890.1 deoxyuridine 5'-triphosphate nucleotidohydrolase [Paenibacillus graminis]